jgi:hypothetical protein
MNVDSLTYYPIALVLILPIMLREEMVSDPVVVTPTAMASVL